MNNEYEQSKERSAETEKYPLAKGGLDDNAKERNFNNATIGYSKRLEL